MINQYYSVQILNVLGSNLCACNPGFLGADCSQFSCENLNNCSTNGYCVSFNVCKCFPGWDSEDCSLPSCKQLANCSGHGLCVSFNECQCEDMFEGLSLVLVFTNTL